MRQRQRITVDFPARPPQRIEDALGDVYGLTPLAIPALLGWASESWLVFGVVGTGVVVLTCFATFRGLYRVYRVIRGLSSLAVNLV